MVYRIAAVSFLNTLPLVDPLLDGGRSEVEVTRFLPSLLAAELEAGRADVALLPVAEILEGRSDGLLAPGLGIACRGAVDSVKLFAAGEPAALRRVLVDRGSRSSVALLRICLAELVGCRPEFTTAEPVPGAPLAAGEGVLAIGDRCFTYEKEFRLRPPAGGQVVDLGRAWLDLTGLPFVFAAWAAAPGLVDRIGPQGISDLSALLEAALDEGFARRRMIAAREAAAGRMGPGGEATAEAITYYFEHSLHFRLGADDLAGVDRFRELCIHHGLLPRGTGPLAVAR